MSSNPLRKILVITSLLVAVINAQTLLIDMDSATGVQSSLSIKDTGGTIIIPLRIAEANNMFSYQFKVVFDTVCFSYIAAEPDFGISGERNLLTKNGGNTIGICQLQPNPPAKDTVVFSSSITGTDESNSVSGDGLVGVLYLRSKLKVGDSTTITICDGLLSAIDKKLVAVENYKNGIYRVRPSSIIPNDEPREIFAAPQQSLLLFINSTEVHLAIPTSTLSRNPSMTIKLLALNGRLIALHTVLEPASVPHIYWSLDEFRIGFTSCTYLCVVEIGTLRISSPIRIM